MESAIVPVVVSLGMTAGVLAGTIPFSGSVTGGRFAFVSGEFGIVEGELAATGTFVFALAGAFFPSRNHKAPPITAATSTTAPMSKRYVFYISIHDGLSLGHYTTSAAN